MSRRRRSARRARVPGPRCRGGACLRYPTRNGTTGVPKGQLPETIAAGATRRRTMGAMRKRLEAMHSMQWTVVSVVLTAGVAAASLWSTGCAGSESDAHRWETTGNGPDKLYALVVHDKSAMPLREEAAISLIRMNQR